MTKQYIYSFEEGNKKMKQLLGGKGANLSEMTNLGLPVPRGFTISTDACSRFYEEDEQLWDELLNEMQVKLEELEEKTGKTLSTGDRPLFLSVRSGSSISMPGMMDTILNLGLNDQSVEALAESTANESFAYESYTRFIQMFSDVVMGIGKEHFDELKEEIEKGKDTLAAEDFKKLLKKYKALYEEKIGEAFPQDPQEQLERSVEAVFKSWENPRAVSYRKIHKIPDSLGTAVNVQEMVFGNMGEDSGTGVAFTRNPSTGENALFGEYLMNAQGEDVVAGIRTPSDISELEENMPDVYQEFIDIAEKLEANYQDMQDIEFTIEKENLFLLQTRNGKRTAQAAIDIAVDLVHEGVLTKEDALMRVDPNQINQLLHPKFNEEALAAAEVIGKGLPASPGAASGRIYFTAETATEAHARGEKVILVRQETSPEDIEGMIIAEGILTSRGGMTSHAAVVARGIGKSCIVGSNDIRINEKNKTMQTENLTLTEGDVISLDGSEGLVYPGDIDKVGASQEGKLEEFMTWVDETRTMKVRTNADSPSEAHQALEFGAEGIGLTRTEHMFFDEARIFSVRKMILSNTLEEREAALAELLPVQKEDFYELYKTMGERPVTVRLLDPPLHEFLPTNGGDIKKLADSMGISFDHLNERIEELSEVNPMLGHRGCRLAVTYPEIYRMQTRAIIEAAIDLKEEGYPTIIPEIMIPLVSHVEEVRYVKQEILEEIDLVFAERENEIEYSIGTMIEVPRAALTADEIAEESEFFSFGTNDLSQMAFGFSRDDSGKFLNHYHDKRILADDPFETIDQKGVGKLMEMAIELGKKTRPDIDLGICGEHGGEPRSVEFAYEIGLDYVSCSPFRVPIAKLAAAQAAIKNPK